MKKTLILYIYLPLLLSGQAFNGMTLFAPTQGGGGGSFSSYLVNNEMDVIKSWSHSNGAASMPYLLQDSSLVYPYRVPNPSMSSGVLEAVFLNIIGKVTYYGTMRYLTILTSIIMI